MATYKTSEERRAYRASVYAESGHVGAAWALADAGAEVRELLAKIEAAERSKRGGLRAVWAEWEAMVDRGHSYTVVPTETMGLILDVVRRSRLRVSTSEPEPHRPNHWALVASDALHGLARALNALDALGAAKGPTPCGQCKGRGLMDYVPTHSSVCAECGGRGTAP